MLRLIALLCLVGSVIFFLAGLVWVCLWAYRATGIDPRLLRAIRCLLTVAVLGTVLYVCYLFDKE